VIGKFARFSSAWASCFAETRKIAEGVCSRAVTLNGIVMWRDNVVNIYVFTVILSLQAWQSRPHLSVVPLLPRSGKDQR